MMFSYAIAATIARFTHGWTQLRSIDEAWTASRNDDLHRSPLIKAAALLVARDASGSVPVTTDRTHLLIGIMSAVGLVLLIALVSLLLWSRRRLHAQRKLEEYATDAAGNIDYSGAQRTLEQPRSLASFPSTLVRPCQTEGRRLPIHARPDVQRERTALPIHAPPKDQRKSMKLPIQSPPRFLVRPPSFPDSAYTPVASLRATNYQHTPPHTRPDTQRTHRGHKDLQPIGAIVIRPPGLQTQLDPPPPYAQLSYLSLSG